MIMINKILRTQKVSMKKYKKVFRSNFYFFNFSIQQRSAKLMYNQEKDIKRFFVNKINEIKADFENEREEKTKKDLRYLEKENQLSAQLEWIKDIAQKINQKNIKL